MAQGPGKYDDLCTYVRENTEARAVVVIVLGGNNGSGFSVQAHGDVVLEVAQLLRSVADQMDADVHHT